MAEIKVGGDKAAVKTNVQQGEETSIITRESAGVIGPAFGTRPKKALQLKA